MYEFVLNYWDSILVAIGLIIALVVLLRYGATKQVNEILFYLVTRAEEEYGNGTGELKYASVVVWLYERLPTICRWLFTKKQINDMIEKAVQHMKEYLANNTKAQENLKAKQYYLQ